MADGHNRSAMLAVPFVAALVVAAVGGCGGEYTLSATDQIVPVGGQAPVAARLTRQEFWFYHRPISRAPVRFWVDDQPQQAAFTDKKGYVGANVPVPDEPGGYPLVLAYQDNDGDEIWVQRVAYVWPADATVAAVDLDAVNPDRPDHRRALADLAQHARLIYLGEKSLDEIRAMHERLEQDRLPDGPILPWDKEHFYEAAQQLAQLRESFPNFAAGVGNAASAELFQQAGLTSRAMEDLAAQYPAVEAAPPADMPPDEPPVPPADAPAQP